MAPRQTTFSPEELERIFRGNPDLLKSVFAGMNKTHEADKIDARITAAFHRKGFKDVVLYDPKKTLPEQPDVTILTYAKWMELGRKVKPGEHAVRVKGYHVRLFHKSQTENATVTERKAYHKKRTDAMAKREAKAGMADTNAAA